VIRIVIGDYHPIVRYGLRHLFALEADMEVVADAGNGREVLNKVRDLSPDVLLLAFETLDTNGLTVLRRLHEENRHPKVMMTTGSENKSEMVEAMKLGCAGIIFKTAEPVLFVEGIRRVFQGEMWLDPRLSAIVAREISEPEQNGHTVYMKSRTRTSLSKRELEVIQLTASGYRNKEIAERLSISHQTIKNHLHNIFDKLGVTDRLELALFALHSGMEIPTNGAAMGAKAG
jgi:DNA-binding NarL/FixJ family response regulator